MDTTTTATLSTGACPVRFAVHELVNHLATSALPLVDQRHETRHPVSGPARLGVRLGDSRVFRPLYSAWVTDMSEAGIGLITEGDLPGGLGLYVNLEALTSVRPCILPIQVVYCQRLLVNTHRVGARFVFEVPLPEAQDLSGGE